MTAAIGIHLFISSSQHGKSECSLLTLYKSPENIRLKATAKPPFPIQVRTFNVTVLQVKKLHIIAKMVLCYRKTRI
jgi:hypothetical protein